MVATLKIVDDPKKSQAKPDLTTHANGPSDEDIIFFAGDLKRKRAACKAANKELGRVQKRAINAGITMAELNQAMEIAEIGIDAVMLRFSRLIRYTKALGEPIGSQLRLFDTPQEAADVSREALLNKADAAGFALGLMGENADTQAYPENSDEGQSHLEGWHRGQKVLSTKFMEQNEENAQAEKQAKADSEAAARKAEEKKKAADDRQKKKDDNAKRLADLKTAKEKTKAEKAKAKAAKAEKKNGKSEQQPAAH